MTGNGRCEHQPHGAQGYRQYLFQLQSLGYRGWRYDMVHGYNAKWVAVYNRATHPTFSVGEYDWGAHAAQRGWILYSATVAGDLGTSSSVFDFSCYFTLKGNNGTTRRCTDTATASAWSATPPTGCPGRTRR